MLKIRPAKIKTAAKIVTPVVLLASVLGYAGFQVYESAPAKALNVQFNVVGTHPRASALLGTEYEAGAELRDLAVSGGKIYAGYGDWNGNSDSWGPAQGRTALVPFDIATHTFESQNEIMVGSEAIHNIRKINGSLYVPTTDPSIHGSGGYATNESGSWVVHNAVPNAVHVFDVATLDGSDLWLFGSRDDYPPGDGSVAKAIAWRSTDGGVTWNETLSDESNAGQGFGYERYYWGQKASSKLFMHAAGTVPDSQLRSFDGTSSQLYSGNQCAAFHNRVTSFNGKIVCAEGYIDGQAAYNITIDDNGNAESITGLGYDWSTDFYVDGGYIYALGSDGTIRRSSDLQDWVNLGRFRPNGVSATSIAVANDKIYLGDSRGQILESTQTITEALATSGPETCFSTDGNGTILSYFSHENDNEANPECSKSVTIPDELDGVPVTAIGDSAFGHSNITSVSIPHTVTSIGSEAFVENLLSSVSLPSGLTEIGSYAFANNSLQSVTIPSALTTIESGTFADNQLTTIIIPSGVTSVNDYAFQGNKLTSVAIPNSVTAIGTYAFRQNAITQVNLGSALTTIGYGAFADNLIETLFIPNSVTEIQGEAFVNNKLSSLTLSNNLTEISSSFGGNRLKQVIIPSSVTSIDEQAFIKQSELTEPAIGSGNVDVKANGLDANNQPTLEEYLDSIWYVRLYTQNLANPNDLQSAAYVRNYDETQCQVDDFSTDRQAQTLDNDCGTDFNGDGDKQDIFMANYGGHLINPAFVAINSETQNGQELTATKTLTGKNGNAFINGYMVKDGPTLQESEYNNWSAESGNVGTLAVGDANTVTLTQNYFRVGQTIQVPASMFPGYSLANGSSLVSITLTSAVNEYTFVYELTDPSKAPGAPNTGGGVAVSIGIIAAALIAVAATLLVVIRRKKLVS